MVPTNKAGESIWRGARELDSSIKDARIDLRSIRDGYSIGNLYHNRSILWSLSRQTERVLMRELILPPALPDSQAVAF
jgi:hypothetical protein